MDSHSVIMRIDECLRTTGGLRGNGLCRRELLRICEDNLHLSGRQLFDAFRGHLDMATLQTLVFTWDTWRALSTRRTRRRTITDRVVAHAAHCNGRIHRPTERNRSALPACTGNVARATARRTFAALTA